MKKTPKFKIKYLKNAPIVSFFKSKNFTKKTFNFRVYKNNFRLFKSKPVNDFTFFFEGGKSRGLNKNKLLNLQNTANFLIKKTRNVPKNDFAFTSFFLSSHYINCISFQNIYKNKNKPLFGNSEYLVQNLNFFNFFKNNFLSPLNFILSKKSQPALFFISRGTNKSLFLEHRVTSSIHETQPFFSRNHLLHQSGKHIQEKLIKLIKYSFISNLKTSKTSLIRGYKFFKKINKLEFKSYIAYSRLFFFDLNFGKKLVTKADSGVFKVQKYDYFSDFVIKLTPQSSNYSFSDFLNLATKKISEGPKVFSLNNKKLLILEASSSLMNYVTNDDFFNPYFNFSSSTTSRNLTHFFIKKYFFKNYNYFSKFKLPSIKTFIGNNIIKKGKNKSLFETVVSSNAKKTPFKNYFTGFFLATSKISLISFFMNNLFFFKYCVSKQLNRNIDDLNYFNNFSSFRTLSTVVSSFFDKNTIFFRSKKNILTNLFPSDDFSYFFKKFVIKSFRYHKFSFLSMPWHYTALLKFLEYSSGKKIFLNFNSFLNNILENYEIARCEIWSQRLKSFKRSLGPKLFINESLQIIYTSLKIKDPFFLSNWLLNFFYKISFWKFKLVFRYLQYVLRYFFWSIFSELNLKGLKFQLKGKVSVAGNSRTRTVVNKIGLLSNSTLKNRILYDLNLIRTFTGVIGFKTWLVF